MLRVIIAINNDRVCELQAVNDGTGDDQTGNYNVNIFDDKLAELASAMGALGYAPAKIGRIEKWQRALGAEALAYEVMKLARRKRRI